MPMSRSAYRWLMVRQEIRWHQTKIIATVIAVVLAWGLWTGAVAAARWADHGIREAVHELPGAASRVGAFLHHLDFRNSFAAVSDAASAERRKENGGTP
jgi:hypothetical protein